MVRGIDDCFKDGVVDEAKVKEFLRTKLKNFEKRAVNDGMKKGLQKGIQIGFKKTGLEIAKALLSRKMGVREISEITGLSVYMVRKIKE